jgi:undecaprenyl-diphosphatase
VNLLSVAAVAIPLLVALTAVWAARRPHLLHATMRRVGRLRPLRWAVVAAGRRGQPAVLARRLGVEEAVALLLLTGLLVVSALGALFTVLLDDVLDGDGIAHLDQPTSRWLAAHREGWLTGVLRSLTVLGSPVALAALMAAVCIGVGVRGRSWRPAVLGVVGAGGIGLVIVTLKVLVGRPRPAMPFAVLAESGYSFPSGHAAGTAAVALLSSWLLTHRTVRPWAARVAIWTVSLLLVGAVGFSRIYLGVHYLSDVLAGWLLGAVWAGTLVLAGTWWTQARRLGGPFGERLGRGADDPRHR